MTPVLLPIWIIGVPVVVLIVDWMLAPGTSRRSERPLSSVMPASTHLGSPS